MQKQKKKTRVCRHRKHKLSQLNSHSYIARWLWTWSGYYYATSLSARCKVCRVESWMALKCGEKREARRNCLHLSGARWNVFLISFSSSNCITERTSDYTYRHNRITLMEFLLTAFKFLWRIAINNLDSSPHLNSSETSLGKFLSRLFDDAEEKNERVINPRLATTDNFLARFPFRVFIFTPHL